MAVLGVNSSYEEMAVRGAASLKLICQKLLHIPNAWKSAKNES